jgi:hypothetical protein
MRQRESRAHDKPGSPQDDGGGDQHVGITIPPLTDQNRRDVLRVIRHRAHVETAQRRRERERVSS